MSRAGFFAIGRRSSGTASKNSIKATCAAAWSTPDLKARRGRLSASDFLAIKINLKNSPTLSRSEKARLSDVGRGRQMRHAAAFRNVRVTMWARERRVPRYARLLAIIFFFGCRARGAIRCSPMSMTAKIPILHIHVVHVHIA